jgi:hypothetical protein
MATTIIEKNAKYFEILLDYECKETEFPKIRKKPIT